MKIKKKPEHWPNASPENRFDGFTSMVKNMKPKDLKNSLKFLILHRYISKAQEKKFYSWYRWINSMPYEQWRKEIK